MVDIIEIIDFLAEASCELVLSEGILKGGHNGPYYDNESPVRVMAHWIVTFQYEYEKTRNEKYLHATKVAADYLLAEQRENGTLCCRNKEGKDKTNGVIGVAWVIEGLIAAANVLEDDRYYNAAVVAFNSQPFDQNAKVWNRREIDGKLLGFDYTYNHQLWLAAAGALICEYRRNEEIEEIVNEFLSASEHLMRVFADGLISHSAYVKATFSKQLRSNLNYIKQIIKRRLNKPSLKYKEEGYHNFNMYAFAIIHKVYPNHPFFLTEKFKKAVKHSCNMDNIAFLLKNDKRMDGTMVAQKFNCECNVFGFSYNSPAFELPLILKEFSDEYSSKRINELAAMQICMNYDTNTKGFSKNTEDEITLNARVYEFVRSI